MRFLAKVLKHWRVYTLMLLVFTAVATIYGKATLSVYESTAYISARSPVTLAGVSIGIGGSPYNSPALNASNAINELLQSHSFDLSVAQKTDLAKQFDLTTRTGQDAATAQIQREVTVAPATVGEDAVTITVDDASAAIAQQIAQRLIDEFIAQYAQRQIQYDKQAETLLSQQIVTTQAKLVKDQAQLQRYQAAHPDASATDALFAQYQQAVTQDQNDLQTFNSSLNQAKLDETALADGTINVLTILDPPVAPLHTTLHLKKLIIYPGIGLAIALALIALIAGIETLRDRSVYSTQELRDIVEELDLPMTNVESVPMLAGIGDRRRDDDDGVVYSGVLAPVLTALPHLTSEEMTQEVRRLVSAGAPDRLS